MLKLATFQVDCTPPTSAAGGFGKRGPAAGVRDPLYMRGFVLEDETTRCLVASLDYCGLLNRAYDDLIAALADAISVPRERVVVHCIHQHDAPLGVLEIEPLLGYASLPADWWRTRVADCADAAASCLEGMREAASVGRSETRLWGYASNRRIIGPDGKVRGMRYSRCSVPELKAEPVGVIDPMLRTLAFKGADDRLIASMSFYATHPQVANGPNTYSADAPGESMRLVAERSPAAHAFFTGPGGNVTAGKYSSTTDLEGNIATFGKRLADGIALNLEAMRWQPAPDISWAHATFDFPAQDFDKDALLADIADPDVADGRKLNCAALLACLDYAPNQRYPLSLMRIGDAGVLFLAGEPFVEYQLYAQSLIPDRFLAVAANCSDNFLYLPLAESFDQGGYEPSKYCWCSPEIEERLKRAIADILSE